MEFFKPSVSQQLIWLDQVMSGNYAKYNIGGYACLEGDLSYETFNKAILEVLKSQQVYSCTFSAPGGELIGRINELPNYAVPFVDFSTTMHPEKTALEWMESDFKQAFEIEGQYLFCFKLLKVDSHKYFWYAKIHHLISDGWSFKLLLNQTAGYYTSLSNGEPVPAEIYKYSDYATEDEAYYASDNAIADRDFWLDQYKELPPLLFRKERSIDDQNIAGSETLYLNVAEEDALKKIADHHKVSVFQLILGILLVYFSRTRQQSAVAIGMPVLNRTKKVYRNTAGVFMNLLSLLFSIDEYLPLSGLLSAVKQKLSSCLRHQRYQFGNLLRDLQLQQQDRLLYEIRVSYEGFDFSAAFGDLKASAIALSNHAEIDPLAIYIRDYNGNGFDIRFIYNKEYLSQESVQSICNSLQYMMSSLRVGEDPLVAEIKLMPLQEEQAILSASSGKVEERPFATFLEMWHDTVASFPDHIAVSCNGNSFTYLDIHNRATALSKLIAANTTGEDCSIALFLERSEKMVTGMLAAMMCGIPYLPIDTENPGNRIKYILRDARPGILLTQRAIKTDFLEELPIKVVLFPEEQDGPEFIGSNDPVRADLGAQDPCYIMYTSGSTGDPKGVVISHGALVDYIYTFREYFGINMQDVVLQQASIGFDTAVEEIFPVLTTGGRLHVLENRKDLLGLYNALSEERITILSTSPLTVKFLNEYDLPPSLRLLISGGDVLKPEFISRLAEKGMPVYNTYGPTESTVCATYYRATGNETEIPIGKPVANRNVYILDKHLHLMPFGVEGEIFIGGKGVALGYLNRATENAEKFIPSPFSNGGRLYRTGDVGMLFHDGNILFRGRKDEQLSYRGHRIEAREIEKIINRQKGIRNSVVITRELDQVPILTAYVEFEGKYEYTAKSWRQLLSNYLPSYMIPEVWVPLDALPLLPSGKVNKLRLPGIDGTGWQFAGEDQAPPQTPVEIKLCGLWSGVLKRSITGIDGSFFESGGHSLNIVQLAIEIREAFNVQVQIHDLFEHDTIRKQAQFITQAGMLAIRPVTGTVEQEDYPLTHAQERMWILSQLDEASKAYHISGAIKIEGDLKEELVGKAVQEIVNRHESLRTVFTENREGQVRQKVLRAQQTGNCFDVLTPGKYVEKELEEIIREVVNQSFDLSAGPLLRVRLIKLSPSVHLFVYVMHHIISDGWSMEVLLREFVMLYHALSCGETQALPAPIRQFRDFINRVNDQEPSAQMEEEDFWENEFRDSPPVTDLPAQMARPPVKTYRGAEIVRYLPDENYQELKQYCRRNDATLFMGLFAILNTLIYRYSGQLSTVIGTPIANRDEADLQNQIGLFLNILPIRTVFNDGMSFRELLAEQKRKLLETYRYRHFQIDKLITKPGYRYDPSRSPLFDIMIVLHNQSTVGHLGKEDADCILPGMHIASFNDLPKESSQFDMVFSFFYDKGSLKLSLEYNTDIYSRWFVDQFADHYFDLAGKLVQYANDPINSISFLSDKERAEQLKAAEMAKIAHNSHGSLPEHLFSLAERRPEAIALVYEGNKITYAAFAERVRKAAGYLKMVKGVRPKDRVGVMLMPGEWLPVYMYAIWVTGAVYVPVNPAFPELRRQMIIEDACCKAVLTDADIPGITEQPVPVSEEYVEQSGDAYILYTSGTTGQPKGVLVSHKALLLKLWEERGLLSPNGAINTILVTNYCFDVSFLELLLPVLSGGKIVIPGKEAPFHPEDLADIIVREEVNILQGTPAFIDAFLGNLPEDRFAAINDVLDVVCAGGESLNAKLVRFLKERLPGVRLNNHYGPTEVVIDAVVNENIQAFERNCIGRPMNGVRAYILDSRLQLLPRGTVGELYIGGHSLAEGYVNRPGETRERFIPNPFVDNERLYRTGDLVRWTSGYDLEFVGRMDEQVKIRGLRIEPEEIRSVLEEHASITRAIVCCYQQPGREAFLVAYIVLTAAAPPVEDLKIKSFLQDRLPDYMVPALIIPVNEIPLDKNGKADKDRLIAAVDLSRQGNEIIDPTNDTERSLVMIWEELLNRSPVSIRDNFFDLGGSSIQLVKMRAELKKVLGVHVSIKELFRLTTIEDLAVALDALKWLQQGQPTNDKTSIEEFTL